MTTYLTVANIKGPRGVPGAQGSPGISAPDVAPTDTVVAALLTGGVSTAPALASVLSAGVPGGVAAMTQHGRVANVDAANILSPWYFALANRSTVAAKVAVVGDSTVSGYGATDYARTSVQRLAANLRSRHPAIGTPAEFGGRGFISALSTQDLSSFTWPASISGTADVGSAEYGPKRSTIGLGSGGTATFNLIGTGVKIMYVQLNVLSSFKWRVDGGAYTTINAQGSAVQDGTLSAYITLGASGPHVLEVTSDTGSAYIDGVVEWNNDEGKGFHVFDCGHAGWKASEWNTATDPVARWPRAIASLMPDVITIALGTNDESQAVSAPTFQANLTGVITAIRQVASRTPIVLVAWPWPAGVTWDTHLSYIAAMYAAAAADPWTLVCDLTKRMPGSGGGGWFDGLHANDGGHQGRADFLAAFLSPS